MKAIAAVDLNWGIGYKGSLLQRIPGDMKFFKEMTLGKVVIMGRETFESLPGKEPLKDRINIVMSRKEYGGEGRIICHSLDEIFLEMKKYKTEDVFVIGGESIYSQLLPFCTEAYITKIEKEYISDKFFTNLDKEETWELVSTSGLQVHKDIDYKFVKYVNKSVRINDLR